MQATVALLPGCRRTTPGPGRHLQQSGKKEKSACQPTTETRTGRYIDGTSARAKIGTQTPTRAHRQTDRGETSIFRLLLTLRRDGSLRVLESVLRVRSPHAWAAGLSWTHNTPNAEIRHHALRNLNHTKANSFLEGQCSGFATCISRHVEPRYSDRVSSAESVKISPPKP